MMSKWIAASMLSVTLLSPGLSVGAENHKFVSMKEINAKGYSAVLKDGTKVKIVKVENRSSPEKDCRVDINSLKSFSASELKPVAKGATQQLSLKARVDANGAYCAGKGSGCLMTVEIPGFKTPAKKM